LGFCATVVLAIVKETKEDRRANYVREETIGERSEDCPKKRPRRGLGGGKGHKGSIVPGSRGTGTGIIGREVLGTLRKWR